MRGYERISPAFTIHSLENRPFPMLILNWISIIKTTCPDERGGVGGWTFV
jgi:hypothetical protein